jgi:hypothetical protein
MAIETLRDKNLALVAAVADRNAIAVADCLKRGADVHCEEGFSLRCAVYLGYSDMADLLLKNGANVHVGGDEPLFTAIRARDTAMIDMLRDNGASLQAVLDTKKSQLDRESLSLISELQSRDARVASGKRAAELREKTRKFPRVVIKP